MIPQPRNFSMQNRKYKLNHYHNLIHHYYLIIITPTSNYHNYHPKWKMTQPRMRRSGALSRILWCSLTFRIFSWKPFKRQIWVTPWNDRVGFVRLHQINTSLPHFSRHAISSTMSITREIKIGILQDLKESLQGKSELWICLHRYWCFKLALWKATLCLPSM